MKATRHSDIVVIGGGIMGAAIAYYGSKAGLEITVLEKNELASGTSSKCDGNILAIDKDPGFDSQMSVKSQELVHQLDKDLELSFEYRNPGSILVCENDAEMEAANQWVSKQVEAGLNFKMLDRQDLRNESKYFADDLYGGLECKTDSTVNPYMMTFSMFHSAEKQGAVIHKNTEVTNMKREASGEFTLETTKGQFTAKRVVNAAGVWAPLIGKMLDLDIPIVPRKGQLIVASRQQPVGLRKVMEFGYLIGSSREFVGFDTKVDYKVIRQIAKRALRFYPQMADMTVIRTYAGLRPWTEDHLPIISRVDHIPGYYIAAGHEGDGISLAAVTGKLIEEMLSDKETCIPIEPLRLDRFRQEVMQ